MKCVALFDARRVQRPVVGDNAHGHALNRRMPAHRRGTVVGFEIEEVGVVRKARDRLAHVHRLAVVRGHDAEQLLRRVARRLARRRLRRTPAQPPDHLACQAHRVRVVLGQVLAQTGDVGVHERATQLLVGGDLAGSGFEQRRSGQKRFGATAHHDDIVGEAGHVRAARGRRPVHHRDDRNPGSRQPREVVEQRAAADEELHPVLEQIGARRLDQVQERQPVLQRDGLRAQHLLGAQHLKGAGVDAGVARHDHDAHTADVADTTDHRATRDGRLGVVGIVKVAGQGGQLQPGCARIEQPGDALARQQLPALVEQRLGVRGGIAGARLERTQALDQPEHVRAVALERLARDVECGLNRRHQTLPKPQSGNAEDAEENAEDAEENR